MIFQSMGFFVPVLNRQGFCSIFQTVPFPVMLFFVNWWIVSFSFFLSDQNGSIVHFSMKCKLPFMPSVCTLIKNNPSSKFRLVLPCFLQHSHCPIHCTLLKAFHIHCTLLYWFPGNPFNSTLLQSCVTLFTRIELCKWTGVTFHIDKRQYRRQLSPARLPTWSRHGTEWIFLHWRMFYF